MGWRGRGGSGVSAEVMWSHQRKKPAGSLGPPPINQEFFSAAGDSVSFSNLKAVG